MYKLLSKNGQMYAFGLGFSVVLIFLGIVLTKIPKDATVEQLIESSTFDFGLKVAIFLFALAAIFAVVLPLLYIAKNPKSALVGLAGIAVLFIVFLIFRYGFSSTEVTDSMYKFGVSGNTGQVIDGAIKTTIFLAISTLVILFVSEILSFFK